MRAYAINPLFRCSVVLILLGSRKKSLLPVTCVRAEPVYRQHWLSPECALQKHNRVTTLHSLTNTTNQREWISLYRYNFPSSLLTTQHDPNGKNWKWKINFQCFSHVLCVFVHRCCRSLVVVSSSSFFQSVRSAFQYYLSNIW